MRIQKSIKIEQAAADYVNAEAKKEKRSFNYIVNEILVDKAIKKAKGKK